jgi:hypothetical protein
MPCGKYLLHHMSQFKTIQAKKLKTLDCFKIIVKILKLLKVGIHGNTSLAPIVHQKSCILVANKNTYMVSKRMKVYFIDFCFHPKFLVIYD